jgi:hypothetical protein
VTISTILPLPAQFLPQDTAISIKQAATYQLQVVDRFGCNGRDEIVVKAKECMSGLYVPNAFTPCKDGKNDVFIALLFGDVRSFSNRWGEMVFQTRERMKGWDGVYKGQMQNPGVFV